MTTELFSRILQKFVDRSPVTVIVHGLLENLLNAEKLDAWFENSTGLKITAAPNIPANFWVVPTNQCNFNFSTNESNSH